VFYVKKILNNNLILFHSKIYSDSLYTSCVDEVARYHAAKWPNKTFMYVFKHRSLKSETPLWMGSPHGHDLYYIFGVPFFNVSQRIPWYGYQLNNQYFESKDQAVSNYTMHMIANFARW
jgi:carboxylesterase type B